MFSYGQNILKKLIVDPRFIMRHLSFYFLMWLIFNFFNGHFVYLGVWLVKFAQPIRQVGLSFTASNVTKGVQCPELLLLSKNSPHSCTVVAKAVVTPNVSLIASH